MNISGPINIVNRSVYFHENLIGHEVTEEQAKRINENLEVDLKQNRDVKKLTENVTRGQYTIKTADESEGENEDDFSPENDTNEKLKPLLDYLQENGVPHGDMVTFFAEKKNIDPAEYGEFLEIYTQDKNIFVLLYVYCMKQIKIISPIISCRTCVINYLYATDYNGLSSDIANDTIKPKILCAQLTAFVPGQTLMSELIEKENIIYAA